MAPRHGQSEIRLVTAFAMAEWNPDILRKYAAPGIAEFTSAEIPDLSEDFPQAPYWLANHFLNSVFRGPFTGKLRQMVLEFIRKSQAAFFAYHRARNETLQYLGESAPRYPSFQQYYNSINEWEIFVLHVQMAIDLFNFMNEGVRAYEKDDGSKEERVCAIANHIKHIADRVKKGHVEEYQNVPLWLTNAGISSLEGSAFSFVEASEILRNIAQLAEDLHDPATFKKKAEGRA